MPSSHTKDIPSSILIVGSGVFGLSTAYSLTQNPLFANTNITLVDRLPFPAPDGASIDTSRIVRADYADIAYSSLAFAAQEKWRNEWWGADNIYHEPGLAVVVNAGHSDDANVTGNGDLGREYMRKSMANVVSLGLKAGKRSEGGDVEALPTSADIRRVFNADTSTSIPSTTSLETEAEGEAKTSPAGDYGYINWRSGWADAEGGMRVLRKRLEATHRITFVQATVTHLTYTPTHVSHIHLSNNTTPITADLVILAAGAWTPTLLDMRGICSATGQILAYLPLSDAEQAALENNPTLLNESSGMFIIPPVNNVLKVARHGYGYSNPTTIPHPEIPGEEIEVSVPRTGVTNPELQIPEEGMRACKTFLADVFPTLAGREFSHTRICWYTDTAKGDWLVGYHPKYENLFVATGGSGHAYKFLPVVGEQIVQTVLGKTPEAFRGKWEWPEKRADEDQVWTEDWRGGVKGMVLEEELAKGRTVEENPQIGLTGTCQQAPGDR